jgi:hypothetical protein
LHSRVIVFAQASNGQPYPLDALVQRFTAIEKLGIRSLGLWDSPVPDEWMPLLKQWADQ